MKPINERRARSVGWSTVPVVLATALPKCPLCWMGLMSLLGLGSVVGSVWLRPLAVVLLLVPLAALWMRAQSGRGYAPFMLGLVAAVSMYFCKFQVGYTPGVVLSGAVLFGASLWNVWPKRTATRCRC